MLKMTAKTKKIIYKSWYWAKDSLLNTDVPPKLEASNRHFSMTKISPWDLPDFWSIPWHFQVFQNKHRHNVMQNGPVWECLEGGVHVASIADITQASQPTRSLRLITRAVRIWVVCGCRRWRTGLWHMLCGCWCTTAWQRTTVHPRPAHQNTATVAWSSTAPRWVTAMHIKHWHAGVWLCITALQCTCSLHIIKTSKTTALDLLGCILGKTGPPMKTVWQPRSGHQILCRSHLPLWNYRDYILSIWLKNSIFLFGSFWTYDPILEDRQTINKTWYFMKARGTATA